MGFVALDLELVADVVDIAVRVFPVDVVEGTTFAITTDGLVETGAEGEEVVELFIGADQAVVRLVGEAADCLADVGFAEEV